jgi:hypothetical protein
LLSRAYREATPLNSLSIDSTEVQVANSEYGQVGPEEWKVYVSHILDEPLNTKNTSVTTGH